MHSHLPATHPPHVLHIRIASNRELLDSPDPRGEAPDDVGAVYHGEDYALMGGRDALETPSGSGAS